MDNCVECSAVVLQESVASRPETSLRAGNLGKGHNATNKRSLQRVPVTLRDYCIVTHFVEKTRHCGA